MDNENGRKIYKHELTHIRQKHTYDKLFSQITLCIFWMNPFFRILQKELNMIHEFIADASSIEEGDTESFAHMLLQSHNEGNYLDPAHSFLHSPVKRRLHMIMDTGKSRFPLLKKTSAIPVILLMVIMLSFTVNKNSTHGSDMEKQRAEKIAAEKAALRSI